jgi:hypothetical protein
MAPPNQSNETSNAGTAGFHISDGPVPRRAFSDPGVPSEFDDLPRVYGPPLLFAIPRDPRTIFTYWNVDWSDIFSRGEPIDRQVYLRVKRSDGTDESEAIVEPMLGSFYVGVAQPEGTYQTELGYYDASGGWSAVANSEPVTMPAEAASDNVQLDLATVPFHLSFQRLIDLFRSSNGNALSAILAMLQKRAVAGRSGRGTLTPEEWEVFRAMDLSMSDLEAARQSYERDGAALRRKTEAVLGFGATSPGHGFGGSSPGSSPT